MKQICIFLVLFFLLKSLAFADSRTEFQKLPRAVADSLEIINLLKKSPQSFEVPWTFNSSDCVMALPFIQKAVVLLKRHPNEQLMTRALELLAYCNGVAKHYETADSLTEIVVKHRLQKGNTRAAASFLVNRGWEIDLNDVSLYKYTYRYFDRALFFFRKLGDSIAVAKTLETYGEFNTRTGAVDRGLLQLTNTLKLYKTVAYDTLYKTYQRIAYGYKLKSMPSLQLSYSLKMIENFDHYGAKKDGAGLYYKMAGFYMDMRMYTDAEFWAKKAVAYAAKYNSFGDMYYWSIPNVADAMAAQKKGEAGLLYINQEWKSVRDTGVWVNYFFDEAYGTSYFSLGQYDKAEHYFLNAFKIMHPNGAEPQRFENVYLRMKLGDLYLQKKQYQKALFYLSPAEKVSTIFIKPRVQADLNLLIYKTDSALHIYPEAISHLLKHQRIKDSLFTIIKSAQIADMQTKYETVQKEQTIKTLQISRKLQSAQVARLTTERVVIAGVAFLFLIFGIIFYKNYRSKMIANRVLSEQKEEIDTQNEQLTLLVNDKDQLIEEKEWLLKEIHHRVKNNLQVVLSLLNNQVAYLDNPIALEAIKEAQSRIRTIAVLHQKIYSTKDLSRIDTSSYITDLVDNLIDFFNLKQRIIIKKNISGFKLDLAQAVPVGLIINEAITNAIKHAYPEGKTGIIEISLQQDTAGEISLNISDNGVGISDHINFFEIDSLGIKMMRALCRQLSGNINVWSENGTQIELRFKRIDYNYLVKESPAVELQEINVT